MMADELAKRREGLFEGIITLLGEYMGLSGAALRPDRKDLERATAESGGNLDQNLD